ncbi:sigma-70 family RNA polymerase sigma factor [Bacillus taeanensis]|nr:sigma-70 family RNA polymerase sigma factor [Bacillus taeanensis]
MNRNNCSFEKLVNAYEPMIKKQIRSLNIHSNHDTYYQLGLIGLWEAYERFDPEKGKFSTFAITTVRGKMLSELKKDTKYLEHHHVEDYTTSLTAVDEQALIPLENEIIEAYLTGLNQGERKWVQLGILNGMKIKEIAAQEGTPYETVKSWRKSALRKMRENAVREAQLF